MGSHEIYHEDQSVSFTQEAFPLIHILLGRVVNSSWEDLLNPNFQQLRDTERHVGFLPGRVKLHASPGQLFQERI